MTLRKFWCNNGVAQLLGNNISPALDQQYALYIKKVCCWLLLLSGCFFRLRVVKRINEATVFLPVSVAGEAGGAETMRKVTFL